MYNSEYNILNKLVINKKNAEMEKYFKNTFYCFYCVFPKFEIMLPELCTQRENYVIVMSKEFQILIINLKNRNRDF